MMRLVLIEWLDSHVAVGGWKQLEGFSPQVSVVRSIGWLFRDDAHSKVVVPHLIEPQADVPLQGCGDMTIPTSAIVSMINLKAHEPCGQGHGLSVVDSGHAVTSSCSVPESAQMQQPA